MSTVLNYFAPITSRQDPIPAPISQGPIIIQSLLERAGLDAQKYPPRSWDALSQLITDIKSSAFDNLKRNGLILYLLVDHHLLPSGQVHTASLTQQQLTVQRAKDIPEIRAFLVDNLIPDFWYDVIYQGYWQLDKGFHSAAEPWLEGDFSLPFAQHIILTLSGYYTDPAFSYSRQTTRLVLDYARVAKLDLAGIAGTNDGLPVIQALLIAKATREGLRDALIFARSPQLSQHTSNLINYLWSWLFQVKDPAQAKLVKTLAWLPLSDHDLDSWSAFSLGQAGDAPRGKPRSLALDTLLVRLINSGKVAQALQINAQAEQRPAVYATQDDANHTSNAIALRKRSEMLRLAKETLPEVVRSQLEKALSDEQVAKPDESMEDLTQDVSLAPAAVTSSDTSTLGQRDTSTSVLPGFLQSREQGSSFSNTSTAPSPGYLKDAPPTPSRAEASSSARATPVRSTPVGLSKPLPSQSPFASSAKASPSSSFHGGTGVPSTSRKASSLRASADTAQGPYALLAAQIKGKQRESDHLQDLSVDESMLLSSLLPKARITSAQRSAKATTADTAMDDEDQSIGQPSTAPDPEPNQSASNFEMPKRRYTKKDEGKTTKTRSQKKTDSSTGRERSGPTPRASRLKSSKTMPSVAVSHPRSVATFPEEDEGGQERTGEVQEEPRRRGSSNKRGGRAASESVPGAFPGQEEQEDGEKEEQDDSLGELEMAEVPRRRGSRAPSAGRTTSALPTASTPVRRSTRGLTRASSVASSLHDEGDDDHDDEADEGETDADAKEDASSPVTRRTSRRGNTKKPAAKKQSSSGKTREGEEPAIKTRSGRVVKRKEQ